MGERPSPVLVGLVFGVLLVPSFIALGAPTVAAPAIARGLSVSFGETSWVLTSWALMSAVAMPLFGRLSDRIGLRAGLTVGVGFIVVGSAVAAVAPDLGIVIVGRALGGIGAGAIVVISYATVTARLDGADRAKALGIVAALGSAASGCGPLVGGLLAAGPGWRYVLAAPAVAVAALIPAARLTPTDRDTRAGLDVLGASLLTAGAAAVIVLLQAPSTHFTVWVVLALAVGGLCAGIGLVRHVRRRPHGFVPRRVIAAHGFFSVGIVGLTVFATYYAVLFAVPTLLHSRTGWGSVAVGAALVPAAVASVVGGRSLPVLARRFSLATCAVGLVAASLAGTLVAAFLPQAPLLVAGLAVTAGAFAGAQAVLVGSVTRLVDDADRDPAQSLFTFIAFGGSSVGPALVGGLSQIVSLSHALIAVTILPVAGGLAALQLTRTADLPSPGFAMSEPGADPARRLATAPARTTDPHRIGHHRNDN